MIQRLVALLGVALAAALAIAGVSAEIVTCGGFVRASANLRQVADTKLDYSIVKMHLYTADGLLKYSTECAPNGYYFIPVYDKGSFHLQIEGPAGWTFEPARVPFKVTDDEQQHGCTDDINFDFTGFSLSGRVEAAAAPSCYSGTGSGPAGVSITLVSSADGSVQQTTTVAGGAFSFANVFPGAYSVSATHSTWTLTPATRQVNMAWGNAEVKEPFQLSGYDVRGRVTSAGEPVSGVDLFLYSSTPVPSLVCPQPAAGAARPEAAAAAGDATHLLCAVASAETGAFRFANVPCGVYRVIPFYKRTHTTYDVMPATRAVNVTHTGTVDLSDAPFQVMGFSVSGRVVDRSGAGVEGAAISVDGVQKTVTERDGTYKLEQIQAGKYHIKATKAHVFFHALKSVHVLPNTQLPDITVTAYHICGVVNSGEAVSSRDVALATAGSSGSAGSALTNTAADAEGNYCFEAAPGVYTVTPALTRAERSKNILLSPPSRTVHVTDAPVLNAHFVQARVRVAGRVKCASGSCAGANVKVTLTSRNDDERMVASAQGADGTFSFADVLPGTYAVSVSQSAWCFAKQTQELNVEYADIDSVEFVQSGYQMALTTSHDGVVVKVAGADGDHTHTLPKGSARVCVAKSGAYTVTPVTEEGSCFRFAKESFAFDTASAGSASAAIDLSVRDYKVSGTVEASASSAAAAARSLPVEITYAGAKQEVTATFDRAEPRQKGAKRDEVRIYKYSFWASAAAAGSGKPYVVSAPAFISQNSEQTDVVFYPRTRDVLLPDAKHQHQRGCPAAVDAFEGRAGVYMSGSVSPATAGVTITLSSKAGDQTFTTDSYGRYRAGPLYDDQQYRVAASADGYHFKEETAGHFRAVKLGQIALTIVDQSGSPVSGVLLSLSGGDGYRRTNQTDANGKFVFSQLFPGDYFLRPLLKEYEFEPSTRSISVRDAAHVSESFAANRIAYSVFGVVKSLNGEPERNVVVEALQDVAEGQPRRMEDTKTDANGAYRIRGLMPSLTYRVGVKLSKPSDAAAAAAAVPAAAGAEAAARIERSAPDFVSVKVARDDTRDVDFIAFRRTGKYDVTGTVQASAALINTQLQQLEVVLASAATPTAPFKTHALTRGFPFFEFSAVPEGRYVVFVRPAAAYSAPAGLPAAAAAAPVISDRTHALTASTEAVALFGAHAHVTPSFAAEYKALAGAGAGDEEDGSGAGIADPANPASSLLTLVLAVAAGYALLNRKQVNGWIEQAKATAQGTGAAAAAAAAAGAASEDKPKRSKKGSKKP